MSKKVLYSATFLLLFTAFVIYLSSMNNEKDKDITQLEPVHDSSAQTEDFTHQEDMTDVKLQQEQDIELDTQAENIQNEIVVIEGTLMGFMMDEDVYRKKFHYMLVNDGTEILRIDLRPLIGYSNPNDDLTKRLGIERTNQIKVTGAMRDGEFKITAVDPL